MFYAFDLRQVCGGYAYFATFTHWSGPDAERYERREPSPVDHQRFSVLLEGLGHRRLLVESNETYRAWLHLQGWALVDARFVREEMQQWLKQRRCILSPLGTFTDIEIASPGVLKRSFRGMAKAKIHQRDGERCLLCDAEDDLTLQHVLPYSCGGETSSRNLVTLCEPCNQKLRDEMHRELYRFAGLHHGYEPSLIKSEATGEPQDVLGKAAYLSSNLMYTRCDLW
jgi:hypothetical protein